MLATQMQWLEDDLLNDDVLIQLKMPELCSVERREGHDVLMSALAYLPLQQRLEPVASLTQLNHDLLEKTLLPMTPVPTGLDVAATYQRDYGWPLPDKLLEEAKTKKNTYRTLLTQVLAGNKATLAGVGLGAEYVMNAQQRVLITQQLAVLNTQNNALEVCFSAVKQQGLFIAYRSEWLATADHGLNKVLDYLTQAEKAFEQNRSLEWSAENSMKRRKIEQGLQAQKTAVQALHRQLHETMVARLNQASQVCDPTFQDVYGVLRKKITVQLQSEYELVCNTLSQLKKEGWLSVPKPLSESSELLPTRRASVFESLHNSVYTSSYAGLTSLNCTWLQVDPKAAIPTTSVQIETRWPIPKVLLPWIPAHTPGFFSWLGSYFAYQMPRRYALSLAFINSHMHRLNTIFDDWSWRPPQTLKTEPIGKTLQQVEKGVSVIRTHLRAQKRFLLWRWLCYLVADRQTHCINALLNVCDKLEKHTLMSMRQRWLRAVLEQYEAYDYAPTLQDQGEFSTELSSFPLLTPTDHDEKIMLESRWETVCAKSAPPKSKFSEQKKQHNCVSLEALGTLDPHLEQIALELPDLLKQTQKACEEIKRLQQAVHSSEQASTEIELPSLTWDEVETILQAPQDPSDLMGSAFKALTEGYLVNEPVADQMAVEPETLRAYYRQLLRTGFKKGASESVQREARFAQAALMQLNKRLRQALRSLPNLSMTEVQLADHSRWIVLAVRTLKTFNTLGDESVWTYRMEKILHRYAQGMQRFQARSMEPSRQDSEYQAFATILGALGQEAHQTLWKQMYPLWQASNLQETSLNKITELLAHLVQRKRFLRHVTQFNACSMTESAHISSLDAPQSPLTKQSAASQKKTACIQWIEQQRTKAHTQTFQPSQAWAQLFHETHTHLACDVFGQTVLEKTRQTRHKDLFSYQSYELPRPQ